MVFLIAGVGMLLCGAIFAIPLLMDCGPTRQQLYELNRTKCSYCCQKAGLHSTECDFCGAPILPNPVTYGY